MKLEQQIKKAGLTDSVILTEWGYRFKNVGCEIFATFEDKMELARINTQFIAEKRSSKRKAV